MFLSVLDQHDPAAAFRVSALRVPFTCASPGLGR